MTSHIEPNTLVAGTTGLEFENKLKVLNEKLSKVEESLHKETKILEEELKEWNYLDAKAEEFKKNKNAIVRFNINGKPFTTSVKTLLSKKDTIFYKLVLNNQFDFKSEIYLDRCPKAFSIILNFLRYDMTDISNLSIEDVSDLIIEANYFGITELVDMSKELLKVVKIVKVEYNKIYSSTPLTEGVKLEELLAKKDNGGDGVATCSPGIITIELNRIVKFDQIEIRGYNKNTSYYANSNGSGAKILTSVDKSNWKEVGTVPSNFGPEIIKVSLSGNTKAKFIKFDCNSYIGLSYFNIVKK